ncbi:MAG: CpaF family protein [Clostridiales bacterium]|nr:CpaF family protein [Clostridiales bacterium]
MAGEQWQEIRMRLLDRMDLLRDLSDEELKQCIAGEISRYGREHLLSLRERAEYQRHIFNSFRKLDVIRDLLDDDEITEIMINGPQQIFYEKKGQIFPWEGGSLTGEKLADVIQQIVGNVNRTVNEAQPIVDARLEDGSRVNVVLSPIAIDGSAISIRKFPKDPMPMERLVGLDSLSEEAAGFLILLVRAGYNIFVSGGTGSGKTTFLNALSEHIPPSQRVVTIEDSAELQMRSVKNLVRLETRQSNGSGSRDITIRDLIRTALRMRPDRIIVGEVRGAEALDMLQSLNTGHDGSLSTGHANSSEDMLSRLETMVLMGMDLPMEAIRRQIASGIDILVHLGRLRDRSRKVLRISEVNGIRNGRIRLRTLYQFEEKEEREGKIYGIWKKEEDLQHTEKLQAEGLEEAYREFLGSAPKG